MLFRSYGVHQVAVLSDNRTIYTGNRDDNTLVKIVVSEDGKSHTLKSLGKSPVVCDGETVFAKVSRKEVTRIAVERELRQVVPNLTLASYTVDLVAPGKQYYARRNQIDTGLRKIFRVGKYQISGQMDIFNVINSSYVKSQNINWRLPVAGEAFNTFGQPLDVLQPRTLRLAAQIKF